VPKDFKGKFKVLVAPALGPFKWEAEDEKWVTID